MSISDNMGKDEEQDEPTASGETSWTGKSSYRMLVISATGVVPPGAGIYARAKIGGLACLSTATE